MEDSIKRKIVIGSVVAVAILLTAAVVLIVWRGLPSPGQSGQDQGKTAANGNMKDNLGEDAAKDTQKLIDEVKNLAKDIKDDGGDSTAQKMGQVVTFTKTEANGTTTVTKTEEAVVVAPESNPISVETGDVLTRNGDQEAKNDLQAGDPSAPVQSDPVDPALLPASTYRVVMSANSAVPKQIKVKAKQAVALAISAEGTMIIFKFDDPSLSAVAMGLAPGETRVITFNAPDKPGNYVFYSDLSGHRASGAEGLMTVE